MTRFLAVAILFGLVTNVGCTQLRQSTCSKCLPSQITTLQNAPRPEIQRAGYHQPSMGIMQHPAMQGDSRGGGVVATSGHAFVNGCVDAVLDCPGGCGSACGCGPNCGPGGCYGGPGCMGGNGCMGQGGMGHAGFGPGACGPGGCHGPLQNGACMTDAAYNFNPGPPTGTVAYPYYTTRGPRDFFCDKPPSIGPY